MHVRSCLRMDRDCTCTCACAIHVYVHATEPHAMAIWVHASGDHVRIERVASRELVTRALKHLWVRVEMDEDPSERDLGE